MNTKDIAIAQSPSHSAVGAQFIAPPTPILASPAVPFPNHSAVGAQIIAPTTPFVASTGAPGDSYGGAMTRAPTPDRTPTLGEIVRGFKARTTHHLRRALGIVRVWQRNYYERVIRDEGSLNRIREYITNTPLRWAFDRENPVHHVAMDQ